MYNVALNISMNGVRFKGENAIITTSDRTLAEVFDENSIPYSGITITMNGAQLDPEDFDMPIADVVANRLPNITQPSALYFNSVKAQDCAA